MRIQTANAATKIHDDVLKHSWISNSKSLDECRSNITGKVNCITTLTLRDKAGSRIAPTNYIYPIITLKDIVLPAVNISVSICFLSGKISGTHYSHSIRDTSF